MGISALAQLLATTANGVAPTGNAGDPNMPLVDFAALLALQLPAGLQKGATTAFPPGLAVGLHKNGVGTATPGLVDETDSAEATAPTDLLATSETNPTTDATLALLATAQQGRDKAPTALGRKEESSDKDRAEKSASHSDDTTIAGTAPEQWIPAVPVAETAHSNAPNTPAAELAPPVRQAVAEAASQPVSAAASEAANLAAESNSPSDNGNGFANLMATHTAAAERTNDTPATTSSVRVDTPLHDHHWAPNFSERVVWLAKNEQQSAQININPPQLGPVQVTINLSGDQASATFVSPHAEVRQAIQDAMPQLREMLSATGINLGQANVGSQLAQQGREFASQFADQNRSARENDILPADSLAAAGTVSQPIRRGRGMVDLFA